MNKISDDLILVFIIIFIGLSLRITLTFYILGQMYFITERFFKSRFIKKDDQKADSPTQMRTAESPSIEASTSNPEEIQKKTRESQEKSIKTSPSIQGSSDTSSHNSSNSKSSTDVSGKKNLQT